MTQNARKRCCWHCNIWPDWFTSHQSHYCLYYNGISEVLRKSLMLTAKTMQNIWYFIVGKSSLQEMATLAIILEISDSNLESGRYRPKSGVSGIIQESWQLYFCLRPWNMAVNSVVAASFFSKYKYKKRKVAISSLLSYTADLPLICSCLYQLWYCTSNT